MVPLPHVVAEALSVHIDEVPPGEDGTLFTTRFGTPYRHDYYGTRIFAEAVAKSGLPPSTTSHDLRHHYASVLWHKVSRWWPWPSGWDTTTPRWSCRRTAI